MAITADIDETDRAGIALCAFQVTRQLGLVFREQGTSDFGVDAQAAETPAYQALSEDDSR